MQTQAQIPHRTKPQQTTTTTTTNERNETGINRHLTATDSISNQPQFLVHINDGSRENSAQQRDALPVQGVQHGVLRETTNTGMLEGVERESHSATTQESTMIESFSRMDATGTSQRTNSQRTVTWKNPIQQDINLEDQTEKSPVRQSFHVQNKSPDTELKTKKSFSLGLSPKSTKSRLTELLTSASGSDTATDVATRIKALKLFRSQPQLATTRERNKTQINTPVSESQSVSNPAPYLVQTSDTPNKNPAQQRTGNELPIFQHGRVLAASDTAMFDEIESGRHQVTAHDSVLVESLSRMSAMDTLQSNNINPSSQRIVTWKYPTDQCMNIDAQFEETPARSPNNVESKSPDAGPKTKKSFSSFLTRAFANDTVPTTESINIDFDELDTVVETHFYELGTFLETQYCVQNKDGTGENPVQQRIMNVLEGDKYEIPLVATDTGVFDGVQREEHHVTTHGSTLAESLYRMSVTAFKRPSQDMNLINQPGKSRARQSSYVENKSAAAKSKQKSSLSLVARSSNKKSLLAGLQENASGKDPHTQTVARKRKIPLATESINKDDDVSDTLESQISVHNNDGSSGKPAQQESVNELPRVKCERSRFSTDIGGFVGVKRKMPQDTTQDCFLVESLSGISATETLPSNNSQPLITWNESTPQDVNFPNQSRKSPVQQSFSFQNKSPDTEPKAKKSLNLVVSTNSKKSLSGELLTSASRKNAVTEDITQTKQQRPCKVQPQLATVSERIKADIIRLLADPECVLNPVQYLEQTNNRCSEDPTHQIIENELQGGLPAVSSGFGMFEQVETRRNQDTIIHDSAMVESFSRMSTTEASERNNRDPPIHRIVNWKYPTDHYIDIEDQSSGKTLARPPIYIENKSLDAETLNHVESPRNNSLLPEPLKSTSGNNPVALNVTRKRKMVVATESINTDSNTLESQNFLQTHYGFGEISVQQTIGNALQGVQSKNLPSESDIRAFEEVEGGGNKMPATDAFQSNSGNLSNQTEHAFNLILDAAYKNAIIEINFDHLPSNEFTPSNSAAPFRVIMDRQLNINTLTLTMVFENEEHRAMIIDDDIRVAIQNCVDEVAEDVHFTVELEQSEDVEDPAEARKESQLVVIDDVAPKISRKGKEHAVKPVPPTVISQGTPVSKAAEKYQSLQTTMHATDATLATGATHAPEATGVLHPPRPRPRLVGLDFRYSQDESVDNPSPQRIVTFPPEVQYGTLRAVTDTIVPDEVERGMHQATTSRMSATEAFDSNSRNLSSQPDNIFCLIVYTAYKDILSAELQDSVSGKYPAATQTVSRKRKIPVAAESINKHPDEINIDPLYSQYFLPNNLSALPFQVVLDRQRDADTLKLTVVFENKQHEAMVNIDIVIEAIKEYVDQVTENGQVRVVFEKRGDTEKPAEVMTEPQLIGVDDLTPKVSRKGKERAIKLVPQGGIIQATPVPKTAEIYKGHQTAVRPTMHATDATFSTGATLASGAISILPTPRPRLVAGRIITSNEVLTQEVAKRKDLIRLESPFECIEAIKTIACETHRQKTIQTEEPILSLAVLNSSIYATLMTGTNSLHVYCQLFGQKLRSVVVHEEKKEKADLNLIAACKINQCLYVSDVRNKRVLQLKDFKSNVCDTKVWYKGSIDSISVTSSGKVLLMQGPNIIIYAFDGTHLRNVVIDVGLLNHAVETSTGTFIVCTGSIATRMHRVCEISIAGDLMRDFGTDAGEEVGKLSRPSCLALDEKDNIFVADYDNYRVMILNSSDFSVHSVILTGRHPLGGRPRSLCYEQDGGVVVCGMDQGDGKREWTLGRIDVCMSGIRLSELRRADRVKLDRMKKARDQARK